MRTIIAAVGMVLAAGWTVVRADDDAAKAAKKLDGNYTVAEYIVLGKPNPKGKDTRAVAIKDGMLTFTGGGEPEAKIKFRVDPAKKPPRFVYLTDAGAAAETGIYELKETKDGTELLIATNADKSPPTDFKGKDGIVFRLRKKKPE
jgi:uncharacterized protein (TIGR03067 family)